MLILQARVVLVKHLPSAARPSHTLAVVAAVTLLTPMSVLVVPVVVALVALLVR
jgi:predicted lipoprotein